MRRSLKVLLGGLALAASSVQAHAQQYWPNPYFQYPPPAMAPMGRSAINYRVVQPVVVYQQPIKPTVAAQPQVQPPAAIQPVRHQVPETPVVAPAPSAVPTIAGLAAQPTMMPAATTMAIGAAAEPLAPAAPAAPATGATNTDLARAPETTFGDGFDDSGTWVIAFGAGVDIIKPHWKTNPSFAIVSTDVQDGGEGQDIVTINANPTDFSYDCSVAPFVWGAIQCPSGLGARARGWWYSDNQGIDLVNDGTFELQTAAPLGLFMFSNEAGDLITVASSLRIRTLDFEATYGYQRNRCRVLVAGGARYGYISQDYNATLISEVDAFSGVISSGHNFSGAGPTIAVEGSLNLGDSGFALLASTRGSLLFGHGRQTAFAHFNDEGEGNEILNLALEQKNDDVLPVWDLELGGEYSRSYGNVNYFFQAAFVAQVWFGAGNAANNDPIIFTDEATDKNADLGLYGLRLTGGFRY